MALMKITDASMATILLVYQCNLALSRKYTGFLMLVDDNWESSIVRKENEGQSHTDSSTVHSWFIFKMNIHRITVHD